MGSPGRSVAQVWIGLGLTIGLRGAGAASTTGTSAPSITGAGGAAFSALSSPAFTHDILLKSFQTEVSSLMLASARNIGPTVIPWTSGATQNSLSSYTSIPSAMPYRPQI